jgi:hypothetical protein
MSLPESVIEDTGNVQIHDLCSKFNMEATAVTCFFSSAQRLSSVGM